MPEPAADSLLIRRAGVITFLLTAMIAVGIWLVFYPGIMSYDSIDQYRQARTGELNSWHPPIMVAVLSLIMALGRNIGFLMLIQCLVGIFGIREALLCTLEALTGRRSARTYWAAAGLTLAILSPLTPAAFYLMTFWKDCWTTYLLVWVVALSLKLFREAPQLPAWEFRPRLAVLVAVMALSALPRHNALVVMPVMGLLLWGILARRGVRLAWPAVAVPIVLAVVAQSSLDRALHVQKTYPGNHVEAMDLLGLCVRYPQERARFPYVSSHMREGIDQYYRIAEIPMIAWEHPQIIDRDLMKQTYNPELDAEYKRAARECPGKLLTIKMLAFAKLLAPASTSYYYYFCGIIDNSFGLRLNDRFAPIRSFYDTAATRASKLPLIRWTSYHVLWFGCDLVLLAIFAWRSLRRRAASDLYWVVVLLVPASYTFGYLLATIAIDYRYVYPSTLLMQILAGAMMFAWLFPPRKPAPRAAAQNAEPAKALSQLGRWSAACLALFVPLLVLFIEMVSRGSLAASSRWLVDSPASSGVAVMLTGSIFLLLSAAVGFRVGGLLTLVLLGLLSVIHATKQLLVSQPLFPWDLTLSRQGANIFGTGYFPHPRMHVFIFAVTFIGLVALAWRLPQMRLRLWQRGLLFLACGTSLYGVAFYRHTPIGRFIGDTGVVTDMTWNQPLNYRTNGLVASFLMNVQLSIVPRPARYDRQEIARLLRRVDEETKLAQTASPPASQPARSEPVDLIVVMNEAFWDPTLLPGVTFRPDPLPFLHGLSPDQQRWLISPVFGGWTCNTGFELLTSCSMSFLPRGSVPYQQYIRRPLPALPRILSDLGYRTVAIHPYARWYWRRDEVFPLFGFQEFLSLENYGATPMAGHYTSDAWVAEEIIRTVEATTDKPIFVFAVTMQNHGSYDPQRYGPQASNIAIQSGLPDNSQRVLEVYTRGASDADRMLETLARYVQARKRPALLVFFGDHLPYLGPDYLAYRQIGFIGHGTDLTADEQHRMHRVPVAYWANFPCKFPRQDISISFLSPLILQTMNVEMPPQMRLARMVLEKHPVLAESWHVEADGTIDSHDAKPDELLEDYKMLQYDLMFGGQYSWEPS